MPLGHLMQFRPRSVDVKPAGQASHSVRSGVARNPAGHGPHSELPVAFAAVPGGQLEQIELLFVLLYLPISQSSHPVWPLVPVNFPRGQSWQTSDPVSFA